MTEPTLDEALHQVCGHCGQEFQWHRVTKAGTSYCLELNSNAAKDDQFFNREHVPLNLPTVPVRMLRRSPFGKFLGLFVNGKLGTFIDSPA